MTNSNKVDPCADTANLLAIWKAKEPRYDFTDEEMEVQLKAALKITSPAMVNRTMVYLRYRQRLVEINAERKPGQLALIPCTYEIFSARIRRLPKAYLDSERSKERTRRRQWRRISKATQSLELDLSALLERDPDLISRDATRLTTLKDILSEQQLASSQPIDLDEFF